MKMRAVESQGISNNQRKRVEVRNKLWGAGTAALTVVAPYGCKAPELLLSPGR